MEAPATPSPATPDAPPAVEPLKVRDVLGQVDAVLGKGGDETELTFLRAGVVEELMGRAETLEDVTKVLEVSTVRGIHEGDLGMLERHKEEAVLKYDALMLPKIETITSIEEARAAHWAAPEGSKSWYATHEKEKELTLARAERADTLEALAEAYEDKPVGKAGQLALQKWNQLMLPVIEAANTEDEAREAYRRTPSSGTARSVASEKLDSFVLPRIEAAASATEVKEIAQSLIGSPNSETARQRACQKYDELMRPIIEAATTWEEAAKLRDEAYTSQSRMLANGRIEALVRERVAESSSSEELRKIREARTLATDTSVLLNLKLTELLLAEFERAQTVDELLGAYRNAPPFPELRVAAGKRFAQLSLEGK